MSDDELLEEQGTLSDHGFENDHLGKGFRGTIINTKLTNITNKDGNKDNNKTRSSHRRTATVQDDEAVAVAIVKGVGLMRPSSGRSSSKPPTSDNTNMPTTRRRRLRALLKRYGETIDETCARFCCRDRYRVTFDEEYEEEVEDFLIHRRSFLEEHLLTPTPSYGRFDSSSGPVEHGGPDREKNTPVPIQAHSTMAPTEGVEKCGGVYDGTFPLSEDDLWYPSELQLCSDPYRAWMTTPAATVSSTPGERHQFVGQNDDDDGNEILNPYETPSMKQIQRTMWSQSDASSYCCSTPVSPTMGRHLYR